MKTSKILMIACVVAFTMSSFSMQAGVDPNTNTNNNSSKTVVHITLAEAVQYPSLVQAMYFQLTDGFLDGMSDKMYTRTVYHANVIWVITGSYTQWRMFFKWQVSIVSTVDID